MNMISLWQESLDDMALKGALVLGAALMAGLGFSKISAARRYPLWMAAVLAALLLPIAATFLPAWQVLPPVTTLPFEFPKEELVRDQNPLPARTISKPQVKADTGKPTEMMQSTVAEKTDSPAPPKTTFSFGWMLTLPMIWSVTFGLLMARLLWGGWRLRRLERQCHEPAENAAGQMIRMMKAASVETGFKKIPRLLLGPANSVPMVWGIFRPCLLLPDGAQHWPQEKLRAVLLHELAHLKRRDPLALWMGQVMLAAHWFNPLAWLTLRRLRADQERACDDTVLRHGIRPSEYAQHLLDLSRQTKLAPGLSLCALAMARSAPVAGRVTAILDGGQRREPATRRWAMLLVSLSLSASLPLAMLHALETAPVRGRILDRNGVVLASSREPMERRYLLNATASHLLGYTRKSESDPPLASAPAQFGGAGVEKTYDTQLSTGQDITLTLDHRIQKIAHKALTEASVTRGAVVVMDPRNGDLLAMVSLPAYDPQDLFPRFTKESWERLTSDPEIPLMNRTTRPFIPGSTFSLSVALAGGLAGIQDRQFECTGSVTYGNKAMPCWIQRHNGGAHGKLGLKDALKNSCECFFYKYGNAAGIDNITKMGSLLGLGELTGIGLEEDTQGILPNPEWLRRISPKDRWTAGHTANTSIGQGMVMATPLQLTVLAATMANGGKVPKPRLMDDGNPPAWRADLMKEGIPTQQIETIRQTLLENVNEIGGSAWLAQSKSHLLAGLTAKAQNWRRVNDQRVIDNHGWFIGFAPYDKPTLAFAVVIQGAQSGAECAPVARQIVEQTLALDNGAQGSLPGASPANLAELAELRRLELITEKYRQQAPAIREKIREYQRAMLWLEKAPHFQPKSDFSIPNGQRKMWKGDWTPKLSPEA